MQPSPLIPEHFHYPPPKEMWCPLAAPPRPLQPQLLETTLCFLSIGIGLLWTCGLNAMRPYVVSCGCSLSLSITGSRFICVHMSALPSLSRPGDILPYGQSSGCLEFICRWALVAFKCSCFTDLPSLSPPRAGVLLSTGGTLQEWWCDAPIISLLSM